MKIEKDKYLQNLLTRKNITKSRKADYRIALTDMYQLTKLTPTELIKEARDEETPYIENDKIIFKQIDERKITQYFYDYYNLLESKNLNPKTIKGYLSTLRTFYKEYQIQLPNPIEISIVKKIIKQGEIPAINDVRKGVESTNNIRNKAIILFMASSGIRSGDVRNFKIGDFLEATRDYYDNLDDLLNSKNNNIIPTWHFIPAKTSKKGIECVTFNTPEATEAIITYLRKRKNLKNNDYLFATNVGNKMNKNTMLAVFRHINDRVFFKNQENKRFFHAHSLRKFFISVCNHNSGDINKVKILSGHSSNSTVHDAYNEINTEVMKRFYTKLIPYLSIRDTRVHDIKPAELVKIEKEKEDLKGRVFELEQDNKEFKELFNDPKKIEKIKELLNQ